MQPDLEQLSALARAEIEATLAALPAPLLKHAREIPVTFQLRPNQAQEQDGIEWDTLGLFVGADLAFERSGRSPLPSQIILFLQNIWDEAGADEEAFREEVRTTFLHELGHYLGLEEDDLFERGLE